MNDPTTGHGETEAPPPEAAETRKPPGTLEAMRRQLVEHSALEDLGPLFGPEAQGKRRRPALLRRLHIPTASPILRQRGVVG